MQFGILPHDESTINPSLRSRAGFFSQLSPDELAEYNDGSDEVNAQVPNPEPEGQSRNGWTLKRMNGQTLVLVENTVIGHIFTIHNDDIYNLHWTHNHASSHRWGRPSWLQQEDCIADLVKKAVQQ